MTKIKGFVQKIAYKYGVIDGQIDRFAVVGALIGCMIMELLVIWWMLNNQTNSTAGRCSALLCASLFVVLGFRFMPCWSQAWRIQGNVAPTKEVPITWQTAVKVFIVMLCVNIVISLMIFAVQVTLGSRGPFFDELESLWRMTDGTHYLEIADRWYLSEGEWGELVQLVFFPGYPLVVRGMEVITGNYFYAAMLVSLLSFAAAGMLLYCLVRMDKDHEEAVRTLKYLCILPGAFFFSGVMTESFFLLLSVLTVYLARREKWFWSCVVGGMAAFTRSLGLALFVPVCFEFVCSSIRRSNIPEWHRNRTWFPQCLCLLIIPLGFAAYCFVCKQVSGEWFKFMEYEAQNWSQKMGLFFNTASYQAEYAIACFREENFEEFLGLWIPGMVCIFGSLLILCLSVKRIRASYVAYFIAYYVVAVGATWLLSAPRYLVALFPISMGLASITKRPEVDSIVTVLLSSAELMYICMFVWRWQVW